MSQKEIVARSCLADAMRDMGEQIAARFGTGPEVMDGLVMRCIKTRHQGRDTYGWTLVVHPKAGLGPDAEDVLYSYYGSVPTAMKRRPTSC
jgi:hypothetical protein